MDKFRRFESSLCLSPPITIPPEEGETEEALEDDLVDTFSKSEELLLDYFIV